MICPECAHKLTNLAAYGQMLWVHAFLVDESPAGCRLVGEMMPEVRACKFYGKQLWDDGSLFERADG